MTHVQPDHEITLTDNYLFRQLDYLDSPEALPMFELQADIICESGFKKIIDVGSRHGPVLDILRHRDYITPDFEYMGFDTSPEPIEIAQDIWQDYPNIEFRVADWHQTSDLGVSWQPDVTIWSGVICYVEHNRKQFFDNLQHDVWNCEHAIIQECTVTQDPHKQAPWLKLPHAQPDIDSWMSEYHYKYKTWCQNLQMFLGRRKTWLLWT